MVYYGRTHSKDWKEQGIYKHNSGIFFEGVFNTLRRESIPTHKFWADVIHAEKQRDTGFKQNT